MKGRFVEKKFNVKTMFAGIVIPTAFIVSVIVYTFILGNGSNFEGGNNVNNPLPGNYFGVVYKGGVIVPVIMTLLLLVITFCIERFLTIRKAKGSGNTNFFLAKVQNLMNSRQIDEAVVLCGEQQGSLANVIICGLNKYNEVTDDQYMERNEKVTAIQKEIEEATALELPSLEQNLVFLSTIASISTLMGLLGTVLGMIKAFAALATAGAPDSVALATGISEALVNTALGISTSALAIIAYNYFTTQIDKITFSIDEAGFSIVQNFAASHNPSKK